MAMGYGFDKAKDTAKILLLFDEIPGLDPK
jgi:hypothetical protein